MSVECGGCGQGGVWMWTGFRIGKEPERVRVRVGVALDLHINGNNRASSSLYEATQ